MSAAAVATPLSSGGQQKDDPTKNDVRIQNITAARGKKKKRREENNRVDFPPPSSLQIIDTYRKLQKYKTGR